MAISEKYSKARWYAFKVCSHSEIIYGALDLVHTCYLDFYERTRKDLFQQDMAFIYHILKLKYYEICRSERKFKWRGEVGNKSFIQDYPLMSEGRTDDLLINNDLLRKVSKDLSDQEFLIFQALLEKKTYPEIGELIGLSSRSSIFERKKNIWRTVAKVVQ